MRLRRTLTAALLIAAASLRAGAAEGDLVLEASVESKNVKLGEDAVLVLTLTNRTASAVKVPSLRLARDSVSVRISGPAVRAGAALTRLYGSFLENDSGGLDFRATATPARTIESGESLLGRIAVPALLTGDLTLTAVLADGTAARSEAKAVTVEVQGRQKVAAQVETSKGSFRIDFDPASSYASVANFWTLARDGFFDGLAFHRVVAGALAQTGDPRGNGTGGPGWYLPGEAVVATSARGDVGLARGAHADSAGSQWLVVADAKGGVAGGYVRLGSVAEGLDVVDRLVANPADEKTGRPKTADRVVSVKTLVR
jgi:cyclophilin family peptidyl-prolyl cis-trans isomerase